MTSESSCGIVKSPAKTHRKGNAFVVNALGLVPPPRHRPHDGRVPFVTTAKKAGVDEHVIKRLSATVLMMLPKSRILKEALSGFVISCNASYHPRFCTIILGEKLFRFVN
jgi:hypothetical protein